MTFNPTPTITLTKHTRAKQKNIYNTLKSWNIKICIVAINSVLKKIKEFKIFMKSKT